MELCCRTGKVQSSMVCADFTYILYTWLFKFVLTFSFPKCVNFIGVVTLVCIIIIIIINAKVMVGFKFQLLPGMEGF